MRARVRSSRPDDGAGLVTPQMLVTNIGRRKSYCRIRGSVRSMAMSLGSRRHVFVAAGAPPAFPRERLRRGQDRCRTRPVMSRMGVGDGCADAGKGSAVDDLATSVPAAGSTAEGDLTEVDTEQLAAQICVFAGQLAAHTCRWLELIAEFDRRHGW